MPVRLWQLTVQTNKLSLRKFHDEFTKIDEETKQQFISEIRSAPTYTIKGTVKQSMKRALPEELLDKTTDEVVKSLNSSNIPESWVKGD